ncbi:hypothetical protein BEP19_04745 [Ammoniphilus oxalaticus]|uniref:HTH marR-type domain-containing protein n=1 Tax=Ammoniphilus oxalaticus TaxID=66863 RepID=A0A419SM35_9BACL|nr:MarR family transcriptional regulator [Ammoniphilus oxalaticus]RKD25129.1 hypothetical protein BEP19_04745 [Ammoniphilus oxalaticus]
MAAINEITELLLKTNKFIFSLMSRELMKNGITVPQAVVIGELNLGPKTIGQLSKALDLSNSTVSGVIDRLERNKIVVRKRDENDRRVVRVSLSQDYNQLGEQYPVLKEDYFTIFFNGLREELTESQLSEMYSSLQLLQEYLERIVENDRGREQ